MKETLRKYEVTSGPYNFQSKEYKAKYLIEDLDAFWKEYEAYDKEKYLMEHPTTECTLLRLDIDIKRDEFKLDLTHERLYTQEDIKRIIQITNKIVQEYTCDKSIKLLDNSLTSVVFEKPAYTNKDGFHILYPYLSVNNKLQDGYIVEKLRSELLSHSKLIVDKVGTKPWVLHESKKDATAIGYHITNVYDSQLNEVDLTFHTQDLSINKSTPIILYNGPILLDQSVVIIKQRGTDEVNKDYEIIVHYKVMSKLSIERATDYDKWIDVGITLFNIGEGDTRFFELWVEFSQRSQHNFDLGVCKRKWLTFHTGGKTIRTLFWWLSIDDKEYYANAIQTRVNDIMNKSIFNTVTDENETSIIRLVSKMKLLHFDVAEILYEQYSVSLVYSSPKGEKNAEWFRFDNGRWLVTKNETIYQMIHILEEPILTACNILHVEMAGVDNYSKYSETFDNYKSTVKNNLGDHRYVVNCLKASQIRFIDESFHNKIDKNRYLLGCNNGVLDFKNECFRPGLPDDYITMTTGVEYKEFDDNSYQFMNLKTFFEEIFPVKEIRELALDVLSLCLLGMNAHKMFVVAVGHHDAGKTVTMSLLEKVFGEYADKLDKSLIIQKTASVKSSQARPDLMITKGKRIIITQETGDEHINIGTVKELTGNDTFYARGLYKSSSGAITPMFTLFLACNVLPRIPQDEEPTWRRIIILEFQSKFIDGAPSSREEQIRTKTFPINRNKQNDIVTLAPCLLWFLFKRCLSKDFHKNGQLHFSDTYLECKSRHRNKNDVIFSFCQDKLTVEMKDDNFITVTNMFKAFKEWFPTSYPSQKPSYDRDKFEACLSRHLGDTTRRSVPGLKTKVKGWTNVTLNEEQFNFT